ncbi:unnamed protein product [Soboliphyme baturini]|uniref:Protein TSSC4 n=1 Tax=Soboliphyme baturini TaxID=241478 RepID=A0A183IS68_9BILA|nr:unnamed protein product [Soboliphyme baturini]
MRTALEDMDDGHRNRTVTAIKDLFEKMSGSPTTVPVTAFTKTGHGMTRRASTSPISPVSPSLEATTMKPLFSTFTSPRLCYGSSPNYPKTSPAPISTTSTDPSQSDSSESVFEDEKSKMSVLQKTKFFDSKDDSAPCAVDTRRFHRRFDSRAKTQPITQEDMKIVRQAINYGKYDVSSNENDENRNENLVKNELKKSELSFGQLSTRLSHSVRPRKVVHLHRNETQKSPNEANRMSVRVH